MADEKAPRLVPKKSTARKAAPTAQDLPGVDDREIGPLEKMKEGVKVKVNPSVAGDNRAAVQNFPDFSLNLPNNPVEPGSFVIVYGTGLGAVTNPVPAGELTPQDPLSEVVEPVTATIGGMEATVVFAGLAPNFAGLMQVNIEVPQLPLGEHEIVLTAGGIQSNAALVSIGSN